MRKGVTLFLLLGLSGLTQAQSFNVDLDIGFGDQQGGNGAPDSAFGGAADNPGRWNRIEAGGPRQPVNLLGLGGMMSNVQLQGMEGLGNSYGYDNYANSGEYALLLNDAAVVSGEIDYRLTGLAAGRYLIYTYAVEASGLTDDATVTVPGADDPVKHVTGPMPGNQFIEGITHSVHTITLTGSSLDIYVTGPEHFTQTLTASKSWPYPSRRAQRSSGADSCSWFCGEGDQDRPNPGTAQHNQCAKFPYYGSFWSR